MSKINLVAQSVAPDGMIEITYHLPHSACYKAVIVKVDGRERQRVEPHDCGIVRFQLPTGHLSCVRLEAVSYAGTEWTLSDELNIRVPPLTGIVGKRADYVVLDEIAAPAKPSIRRGFASIGLHNPKTPENVGGVIRAAHAYGAASVAISGQRTDGRSITHPTNTTRADKHIPIYRGELHNLIPFGAVPVAIELVDDAESLFTFQHPRSAFYIFGPEDSGLGASIREWCEHTVYIPTAICMNIAATVNVVLYDRAMKEAT